MSYVWCLDIFNWVIYVFWKHKLRTFFIELFFLFVTKKGRFEKILRWWKKARTFLCCLIVFGVDRFSTCFRALDFSTNQCWNSGKKTCGHFEDIFICFYVMLSNVFICLCSVSCLALWLSSDSLLYGCTYTFHICQRVFKYLIGFLARHICQAGNMYAIKLYVMCIRWRKSIHVFLSHRWKVNKFKIQLFVNVHIEWEILTVCVCVGDYHKMDRLHSKLR